MLGLCRHLSTRHYFDSICSVVTMSSRSLGSFYSVLKDALSRMSFHALVNRLFGHVMNVDQHPAFLASVSEHF